MNAGYGVVDPLPDPAYCPPAGVPAVQVQSINWKQNSLVVVMSPSYHEPPITFKATPPAGVRVTNVASAGFTIEPIGAWPTKFEIALDITCQSGAETRTLKTLLRIEPKNMGEGNVQFFDFIVP
jgi:hypothetical protein